MPTKNLIALEIIDAHRHKKVGRPRIGKALIELVVRMARENPTWGYDRIEGALKNLRYRISSSSIGNILKARGIEPAPDRKRQTNWHTFLKIHWDCREIRCRERLGGLLRYYYREAA